MINATRNKVVPEKADTSSADRNWPRNIAMVQKLIFSPFFSGVLLLTIRLLNNGVEQPKPSPAKNTAIHKTTAWPDRKYRRKAMP